MRLKTNSRATNGTYTRDGITVPRPSTPPPLPLDWQMIGLRAAIGLVVVLTTVAIVWSTYSIGTLLGGGVGFAAGIVFDASWFVVLVLEYLSRYDAKKREFPKRLGWALLVITMVAIAWEGIDRDAWGMAIIGAMVSFVAKILWYGIMDHVNADLSPDDEAWISAVTSDVQTKAAIAQVRRTAARAETRATKQLLAMERELADVRAAYGTPETAETIEPSPAISAPALTDMPAPYAIRFAASQRPELTADDLAELLADQGVDTTPDEVRQILSVTPRTSVEA